MATTLNVEDDSDRELNTKDLTFQSFGDNPMPNEQINFNDDINDGDDNDDKQDLLSQPKREPSFWTFKYYQQFFDVDSWQVFNRIIGSMIPNIRKNYLQNLLRPNPDLYGPFWVCTTLVFTIAFSGNLAQYIYYQGNRSEWNYDFHKVPFAAAAIYSYWWLIPCIIYGFLWWRGSQAGYTFLEIICIYGYSLFIYIPISILWIIPSDPLQWTLVMLGMALSGSVLVLTFYPAVNHDDKKIMILILTLIVIFHGALAVGFKIFFFYKLPTITKLNNVNVTTAKP